MKAPGPYDKQKHAIKIIQTINKKYMRFLFNTCFRLYIKTYQTFSWSKYAHIWMIFESIKFWNTQTFIYNGGWWKTTEFYTHELFKILNRTNKKLLSALDWKQ